MGNGVKRRILTPGGGYDGTSNFGTVSFYGVDAGLTHNRLIFVSEAIASGTFARISHHKKASLNPIKAITVGLPLRNLEDRFKSHRE